MGTPDPLLGCACVPFLFAGGGLFLPAPASLGLYSGPVVSDLSLGIDEPLLGWDAALPEPSSGLLRSLLLLVDLPAVQVMNSLERSA